MTHLGVGENPDFRESRRICYVNYIALLSALYITIRVLLSLSNLVYSIRLFSLNILVVLVLLLNRHRFHRAAKLVLFLSVVTCATFFSCVYLGGFYGGAFVVLFAAVPWPFMLFDLHRDKTMVSVLFAYLLAAFFAVISLQYIHPLPIVAGLDADIVRISTTALTIILLLLLTWYFHSSNLAAEETLRREKEKYEKVNRQLQKEIAERERAREELRASEHQMRLITDNTPAYIAYVGADDLCYRFVNKKFEESYNRPRDQIIGHHIREIIGEENYRFALPSIEKVKSGQAVSYENVFPIAEGRRWIQVNYVPDFDGHGSVRAIVVMSHDISKLMQAYDELQESKEAAEAANRAKSAFLANMSHELRTPLNAILGFSELMRRSPDIPEGQKQNLDTIGRSGEHLLALINDVLEFSKIEAGRMVLNKEDFDLHRLLLGLEEMFMLRVRQKGLGLDVSCDADVPRYIHGDQNKLRQILINLLGNAEKFTETGGIRLSVKSKPGSDDRILYFEVTDTGCGIPRREQDKIFDAFYQSESQRPTRQGTGLGLSISRKYAELMDGTLLVDSQVGEGTRFTFEMGLEPAHFDGKASQRLRRRVIGLAAGQPVYRMLVAEDNANNRKLLVTLLQSVGFEVREAVNGQEALEKWRQWRPHLIWMDIRMPILDGYAAMAAIKSEMRQTETGIDTKIIALTASVFEEDRLKVIENGGNDFVRKPFREWEIFEMIRKHIGVEFRYEQKEDTMPASRTGNLADDELAASLKELPEQLLARLKEATELSDAMRIDGVIQEISAEDESLAGVLLRLAGNYAYDKILALLEETGGDTGHSGNPT